MHVKRGTYPFLQTVDLHCGVGCELGYQCVLEVVPGGSVQRQAAGHHGDAKAADAPEPGLQLPAGPHLLLLAGTAAAAPVAGHPGV